MYVVLFAFNFYTFHLFFEFFLILSLLFLSGTLFKSISFLFTELLGERTQFFCFARIEAAGHPGFLLVALWLIHFLSWARNHHFLFQPLQSPAGLYKSREVSASREVTELPFSLLPSFSILTHPHSLFLIKVHCLGVRPNIAFSDIRLFWLNFF